MPTFPTMSVPPPQDFSEFENLCCDLWKRLWGDPNAQRHGRRGQGQHGVDVFGRRAGRIEGLQCRTKDLMTGSKLVFPEIERVIQEAENFEPPLAVFTIATTAIRDAQLQKKVRRLSTCREAEGRFSVAVRFWEDIWSEIAAHHDLLRKYYPEVFPGSAEMPPRVAARKEIEDYVVRFSREIGRCLDPLIELTLIRNKQSLATAQILATLRSGTALVLVGTSGVGKSHLVKHLALQLVNTRCLPIIVRSKYYTSDFPGFVDESIGHLTRSTFNAIIAGCQSTQIPVTLFVDGLNEIDQVVRDDLVDKLLQLRLRNANISIAVTTRHESGELEPLGASIVNLSLPSAEQRARLSKAYGVTQRVAERWSDVLQTPLDFKLAGEITELSLDRPITQYSFIHLYLERKLEPIPKPL